jgi:hypothetical protein
MDFRRKNKLHLVPKAGIPRPDCAKIAPGGMRMNIPPISGMHDIKQVCRCISK